MSYEGYEVKYCSNGHKKEVVDALSCMYDPEEVIPCFCGSDEEYWDSVDETNGCECEHLSEEEKVKGVHCGAHEDVPQKPVGYTMVKCKECQGSGMVSDLVDEKCCGKVDCELCYGSGTKYVPSSCNISRRCTTCLGRGTEPVPIYDISVLKVRHK